MSTNHIINTVELRSAVDSLVKPKTVSTDERKLYQTELTALETKWKVWLGIKYGSFLPQTVRSHVFTRAWEEAHSKGYEEVERQYCELAKFAGKVIKAIKTP